MQRRRPSRPGSRWRVAAPWISLAMGLATWATQVGRLTHSLRTAITLSSLFIVAAVVLLSVVAYRRRAEISRQLSSRFIDLPGWLDYDCLPEPWPAQLRRSTPNAAQQPAMPVRLRTVPGRIVLEKSDPRDTAIPFRAEIPASRLADVAVEAAPWIGSALTLVLTSGRRVTVEVPTKPQHARQLADSIRRGIGITDLEPGDLVILAAPAR